MVKTVVLWNTALAPPDRSEVRMLQVATKVSARDQLVTLAELLHNAMRTVDSHVRLEILVALAAGESDVSALAKTISLEISHVSKNLVKFHQTGIACCRREKKRRIYSLSPAITVSIAGEQIRFRIVAGQHLDCCLGVPLEAVNDLRAERGLPPCTFPALPEGALDESRDYSAQVKQGVAHSVVIMPRPEAGAHAPKRHGR